MYVFPGFPGKPSRVVGYTSSAGGDETGGLDDGECVSYGTCFVPRDVFVSDVKEKIKVNYRARRGDQPVFTFQQENKNTFVIYVNKKKWLGSEARRTAR